MSPKFRQQLLKIDHSKMIRSIAITPTRVSCLALQPYSSPACVTGSRSEYKHLKRTAAVLLRSNQLLVVIVMKAQVCLISGRFDE
jgi:hypothetical protein